MRIFRKALLSLSLILFYANNAYATTTGTYPVEENTGSGKLVLLLVAIGLVALVLFIGYKMDKSEAQEIRKEKIIKKRNKNDEDDAYSNIYNSHKETDEYEEYNSVSEETAVVRNVYPNLNTEMETGYEEELLKEIEKTNNTSSSIDDIDDFDKTAVIEKIDLSKFDNDEALSSGSLEEYEDVETEEEELEEYEEIEDSEEEIEDEEDYEEIVEDDEEVEVYEEEKLADEDTEELEDDFEEVVETDFNKKYRIIDADDIDVYDNYEANYYDYESPYDSTMVFDSAPVKKEPNILEKFSDVKGYDFNEDDREFFDLEKIVTDANVKKFTRKKDNRVKSKKVEQEPEVVDVVISKKYTRKRATEIVQEVLEEKTKRGRKPATKKDSEVKEKKSRKTSTKKTEKTLEEKPKRGRKPAAKKETEVKEKKAKKESTNKTAKTTKTTKTSKKVAEEKTKKTRSKKATEEKTKKAEKSTAKKSTRGTTKKSKTTTKKSK